MFSRSLHSIATFSFSAAVMLGLSVAPAAAFADGAESGAEKQTDAPAEKERKANRKEAETDGPLLSGPTVEEDAQSEGEVTRMGEQRRARGRMPQMPMMLWLQQVRALDLEEDQQEKISSLIENHRKAVAKFHEEHGEELRAIRQQMRAAHRGEDQEVLSKLVEKMQQLRSAQPQPDALQSAVWKELSESQQMTLREQIVEWQRERLERMQRREQSSLREMGQPFREARANEEAVERVREDAQRPSGPARSREGRPTRSRDQGGAPAPERPRRSDNPRN